MFLSPSWGYIHTNLKKPQSYTETWRWCKPALPAEGGTCSQLRPISAKSAPQQASVKQSRRQTLARSLAVLSIHLTKWVTPHTYHSHPLTHSPPITQTTRPSISEWIPGGHPLVSFLVSLLYPGPRCPSWVTPQPCIINPPPPNLSSTCTSQNL